MWPRLLQCRAAGAGGIARRRCRWTMLPADRYRRLRPGPTTRQSKSWGAGSSIATLGPQVHSWAALTLSPLSPSLSPLVMLVCPHLVLLCQFLCHTRALRRQRISTIILSFITICLNPESIWRSLWIQVPCFFLYPFSWYLSLGYVYLNKMMCKYERGNCEELATGIVR